MTTDLRERVLDYMANHHVMTLATYASGDIWAAAVFYVNKGFDLYFLSAAHTRHAEHLAQHNTVAATIQEDYRDWQVIQGVQLEGKVTLLQGDGREAAIQLYRQKFPFLQNAPSAIQLAMAKVGWYQLTPYALYFVDNSRGFGHRDQVPL